MISNWIRVGDHPGEAIMFVARKDLVTPPQNLVLTRFPVGGIYTD
jgi:hypothetical protein